MTMKEKRAAIRNFLRTPVWTDEKLCALLAHAESGRLIYTSCCCLIGVATADHALGSLDEHPGNVGHYQRARLLPYAVRAEAAYHYLALYNDASRRRILRPIIRAELKRRELVRIKSEYQGELVNATI